MPCNYRGRLAMPCKVRRRLALPRKDRGRLACHATIERDLHCQRTFDWDPHSHKNTISWNIFIAGETLGRLHAHCQTKLIISKFLHWSDCTTDTGGFKMSELMAQTEANGEKTYLNWSIYETEKEQNPVLISKLYTGIIVTLYYIVLEARWHNGQKKYSLLQGY